MRAFRFAIGIVAAVLVPAAVAAQEETPEKTAETAGAVGAIAMPKPAPEMEKFSWMVGDWSVTETHEPSPWGAGGKAQGTMEIELGPGGLSHILEYESTGGPMGSFSGRGITVWDAEAGAYRGAWTDNTSPGLFTSECREEGSDLVCVGEGSSEGQKLAMRTRSKSPGPQGWTETFEISVDGSPYQQTMTLEYEPKP